MSAARLEPIAPTSGGPSQPQKKARRTVPVGRSRSAGPVRGVCPDAGHALGADEHVDYSRLSFPILLVGTDGALRERWTNSTRLISLLSFCLTVTGICKNLPLAHPVLSTYTFKDLRHRESRDMVRETCIPAATDVILGLWHVLTALYRPSLPRDDHRGVPPPEQPDRIERCPSGCTLQTLSAASFQIMASRA